MQRNIYVVYDRITKDTVGILMSQWNHPAPAIRVFIDELSNPNSMGRHPSDFDLYELGTIDIQDDRPLLRGDDGPGIILTGAAWLAAQQRKET